MPLVIELTAETGECEIPAGVTHADIFLVGAGGGGLSGGGGGGYTGTWLFVKLDEVPGYNNGKIPFVVGRGGLGRSGDIMSYASVGDDGGYTRFGSDDTYQVDGGKGAWNSSDYNIREGGDGGSGGGASASRDQPTGAGGSDGSDGGSGQRGDGGSGQGTTTRAFGESEGELYAGGGGAGNFDTTGQPGGDGGGGDGGNNDGDNENPAGNGQDGEDGKGGGGGGKGDGAFGISGRGGHGIILVRFNSPRKITITDLKAPNEANAQVEDGTGVQVKLWINKEDTGAPDVLVTDATITGGTMEVTFAFLAADGDPVLGVAKWTAGGETYFFPIDTTAQEDV